MKKGLLTLLCASVVSAGAFATADGVELDKTYMDSINPYYNVKLDLTNRTLGLSGLTNDGLEWNCSENAAVTAQSAEIVNNKLVVTSTRKDVTKDNWKDITFQTTSWVGETGSKFGVDGDTMVGQFVDLTNTLLLTAFIETNNDCQVRFDLVDANGNISNSHTPKQDIIAGAGDYYRFSFEDSCMNWYGGDLWGLKNGRNEPSELFFTAENGDKTAVKPGQNIPFDFSKVVKIALVVNDAKQGVEGQTVVVKISELILGDQKKPVAFKPYDADAVDSPVKFVPANVVNVPYPSKFTSNGGDLPSFIMGKLETVSTKSTVASALVVYPNPAKASITVNEEVSIATIGGVVTGINGNGTLDISTLPAGTYQVIGVTGTAVLVVE